MTIDAANSSIPFHVARAYGLKTTTPIRPAAPVAPTAPTRQTPDQDDQQGGKLSAAGRRLIGGVVPGRVDFSGTQPEPSTSGLSIYRHPADKNAAATGVRVGRSLDVNG